MDKDITEYYMDRLTRLRRRSTKGLGKSPHKPVLLLSVIEMIQIGRIRKNEIRCTKELDDVFCKRMVELTEWAFDPWTDIAAPFFHLKNDEDEEKDEKPFWHLHSKPGREKELSAIEGVGHITPIETLVSHASLDKELFDILSDEVGRTKIRQALMGEYFPGRRRNFETVSGSSRETQTYKRKLLKATSEEFKEKKPKRRMSERQVLVREAGFREAIMELYDSKCAACGLRIVTSDGRSATQAAHIIPYKHSFNNDPRNGISLCPLHHWAFDAGLFSLTDKHQMIVSETLSMQHDADGLITKLGNRTLVVPREKKHRPEKKAMKWHRDFVLRRNQVLDG